MSIRTIVFGSRSMDGVRPQCSEMRNSMTMHNGSQGTLTRRGLLAAGAASALGALTGPVWADQGYPSRPISVIVPFPAGGTTDRTVRVLTQLATSAIGQSFVIE